MRIVRWQGMELGCVGVRAAREDVLSDMEQEQARAAMRPLAFMYALMRCG